MWPSVLKVLGGALLTFAVIWALVLGWWQSNDYEPSRLELGLYLAALPLALVGGYLLLRGFIDHLKAPPVAPADSSTGRRDDDPLAMASAKVSAAEREFDIGFIDGCIIVSAGESADELIVAVEGGARPEPCARVTDEAGFPVFMAEVPELDVDTMSACMSDDSLGIRKLTEHEQVVRALAILERLCEALRASVQGISEYADEELLLRVVWMVPAAWSEFDMEALKAWLLAHLSPMKGIDRLEIQVQAAGSELDALKVLDDLILAANREPGGGTLRVLLGATSATDEQSIAQRSNANRLFTPANQQHRIPGEGGVAMLLAHTSLIKRLRLENCVRLSRLSAASRDKPVDAGGRVTGKLIDQLITGLLDVTGVERAEIKTALLDTDHRASHFTEVLEGLGEPFGHLDPIKDCLPIGATAGDISPVGPLVALVCARAKVLATQSPAICISNQHSTDRGVVLVSPFPAHAEITPCSI